MDEEYIYYYTTSEGLFSILRKFEIRLSVLSKSSDLVERTYYTKIPCKNNTIGVKDMKLMADENRYVCFCREEDNTNFLRKEGASYLNMWDAYSDRHKGACIRILKNRFIEKNDFLEEIEIIYKKDKQYLNEKSEIRELMKYKYFIWEHENELRFLRKEGSKSEYCSIEDCIVNVYLGIDFKKGKDCIKKLCDIIKGNKKLCPTWFIMPIILENGNLFFPENDGILWKKMKDSGIDFLNE